MKRSERFPWLGCGTVLAVCVALGLCALWRLSSYTLDVRSGVGEVKLRTLSLGEYCSPVGRLVIYEAPNGAEVVRFEARNENARLHTVVIRTGVNGFLDPLMEHYSISYPGGVPYAFKAGVPYRAEVRWGWQKSRSTFMIPGNDKVHKGMDGSSKSPPAEAKHVLEDEALWFWFADGGDGRKMNLVVKLDDRVLYETVIPIFHAPRASKYSKGQEKRICFEFKAARKIVWSGYKDQDQTTKAGQNIYCDIWLAGADPGAMILGVGFRGPQDNYMNTLAIAYPDRPEATMIAGGLVITTVPVSGGGLRTPSSQKIPPPRSTGSVLDEVEHSTKR